MKGTILKGVLVNLVVIASFLSLGNVAWSAENKPIKILFAFMEPPMGPVARVMIEWSKEVEENTNGKVDVELALGGALGKPGEYFDLTKNNVCDAAACIPAYGGGLFPMSELFELPYNSPSGEVVSKAMVEFAKKGYLDDEFSEVKLMSFFGSPSDIIFTKDKPVTSLDDIKRLKLWMPMPMKIELLKLMGATPVALPPTDLYSGLQKGVIEGAMCNYMFLYIYKIHEVIGYASGEFPSGTVAIATIMNKKKYNSLPKDIRDIIDGMSRKYSIKYGQSLDNAYKSGRRMFLKRGAKTMEWNPGELAKANERITPMWENWIKDKEKKGLPARKAVIDFYNLLKDQGVENPAMGFSP